MPAPESIRSMLTAGRHSLSSGRVAEVVALVRAHPRNANRLIECLWDENLGVAQRAADALEKLSRTMPSIMDSWKAPLLGLLAEAETKKMRWSLAAIIPRLALTLPECCRTAEILHSFLNDSSSIVKTCALQGLADLTRQNPSLTPEVIDLLRIHGRTGTPAMQARSRHLLQRLDTADQSAPRSRSSRQKPPCG